MKEVLKEFIKTKRGIYILSTIVLILFSLALNIAFSAFTSKTTKAVANIKVNDMNYAVTINGTPGTIIKAIKSDTTKANLGIVSLNDIDSKYELIYKVCSDASCTTYIEAPVGLTVEYSSRTTDPITGEIPSSGIKSIRIVVINETANDIYIQIGMNAGYTHNTLELLDLIANMYNEDDLTIAAYINGELQTSFPTTSAYSATVECTVDGQATTATGTATWDGAKWKVDVSNVTMGRTVCNVYFVLPAAEKIIALASDSATTGVYNEPATDYRYEGLTVNNYVSFNNELWRIIGVFGDNTHNKTGENLVKIMRDEAMTYTQWDEGSVNNWETSSLKTYLNGDYYNSIDSNYQGMIASVTWKLGGFSSNSTTTDVAYTAERGTTVYTGRPVSGEGKIGLMYPSDYGYSVLASSCVRTTTLAYYNTSGCYNQSWIKKSITEWTLTPYSGSSDNVWYVLDSGRLNNILAIFGYGVRATLYLNSSVKFVSGDGSQGNPYTLRG